MSVPSSPTSKVPSLALLSMLLLPASGLATEPPPSFMALDICASYGGNCSVDELLRRGFPDAKIAWSKLAGQTATGDSDRWDGVRWQLTITPRRGKSIALVLYRSCRLLASDEGELNLPVAEIDSVDGKDYMTGSRGWMQVERAMKNAARRKPAKDERPSGPVPPPELLDLETCASLVDKGSCTVREFVGMNELVGARWRWMPSREKSRKEGSIVPGWHLVLPPDDESQVAFVFVSGCVYGHPAAELVQIGDFADRPYVASPPDVALRLLRRVVKERPWPPVE